MPARHVETKVITNDHGLVAIYHVFSVMKDSLSIVTYMYLYARGRNTNTNSVHAMCENTTIHSDLV